MFLDEKNPGEHTLDCCSQDLLAAAAYIEKVGWCQDTEQDVKDRVCAGRAIRIVTCDSDERHHQACQRFARFVGFIPVYNDAPGRTASEVIAALRACACPTL
jgi:hypothetical protein